MLGSKLYDEIWKRKSKADGNSITEEGRTLEAIKTMGHGAVLLDIGCGNGIFAKQALKIYKQVIGVDISLRALTNISHRSFPVFQADLNNNFIPLKDNCVDSVVCLDVIEHVYDPYVLVYEVYRILKDGGEFIVTTPNTRFVKHIMHLLLKGISPKTNLDNEGYDGGHLHYFTFKDLRKILEECNFDIVKQKGISKRFYNSLKLRIFYVLSKLWEKDTMREFFCQGILIKAKKKF